MIRSSTIDHHVGISQGFHDAGIAVVDADGSIAFAAHSERYSKKKNDPWLYSSMLDQLKIAAPGRIAMNYYERAWLTDLRRLIYKQGMSSKAHMQMLLRDAMLPTKMKSWPHHLSHAAAAFQTSPFQQAAVVIVDAVGEFDTASIWRAHYDSDGRARYTKLWSKRYPHSVGLFYSALTARVGLRPMEDEYVLMGMAAFGRSHQLQQQMRSDFFHDVKQMQFKDNLHIGVGDWMQDARDEDIAAATQYLTEEMLWQLHKTARKISGLDVVCYGGGVALNCKFNDMLRRIWRQAWICPNPGDCGSALGAAALSYGKALLWKDAFLGHNIPGELDVDAVVDELLKSSVVGVANGRAEWGPRALGNRSLLADPRQPNIKDRVNEIKHRQKYRPFAPAILSEHASQWFRISRFDHSYMQYAVPARLTSLCQAACHVDGTARVQVVQPDGSNMRKILEAWYAKTGYPILLNTSLNIRGQPMVNDRSDADRFQDLYGVRVIS